MAHGRDDIETPLATHSGRAWSQPCLAGALGGVRIGHIQAVLTSWWITPTTMCRSASGQQFSIRRTKHTAPCLLSENEAKQIKTSAFSV